MELNSNLLNECLADAKAVKETALQSAIGTLKETFEPTVRRLITQKLSEEGELEDDVDDVEDVYDVDAVMDAVDTVPEESEEEFMADVSPEEDMVEVDDYDDDLELESLLRELEDEGDDSPLDDEPVIESASEEDDDLTLDDLEEILREVENDSDLQDEEAVDASTVAEIKALRKENARLKANLKEAYKAITTQKSTINEVNLINSKLLFLTKTVNAFDLTPTQQASVLESFDRCVTIKEVKMTYDTLKRAYKLSGNITESKASNRGKSRLTANASKRSRVIKESNRSNSFDFAPRWKKLANI